jgi:glycosyltransferase involved in cell wall biosynthesis
MPSQDLEVVIASNFPKDETLGTARTPIRLAGELEKIGVRVDTLFADDLPRAPRGRVGHLTAPFRMAFALARRARRADVVDIAGWDGFAYGRFARRSRPGQGLVARSNGLWYRALGVDQGPTERRQTRLLRDLYQRNINCRWERSSIEGAHLALFLSRADRDEIVRQGWKTDAGAAAVNPGVDEFFASPTPLAERRDVAFVGTFFHCKGSDVVAAAMSRVMRERTGLRFKLFGVGLPASTVLSSFDPSVRARVSVADMMSPPELAKALGSYGTFVFPTRYEGFGIVVLEAMRAGLAVVTTATGAGSDLMRDGQNGILVPFDSVDATAAAVARLVDDPGLRMRLAQAAIDEAKDRSWARAARELKAVYERVRDLARSDPETRTD